MHSSSQDSSGNIGNRACIVKHAFAFHVKELGLIFLYHLIKRYPDLASTRFWIHGVFKNFHYGVRIKKVVDWHAGFTEKVWMKAVSRKNKLQFKNIQIHVDRALRFPSCPIVKVTRYQGRSGVAKAQPCKVRDKEWCRWLTSKLIYIFISGRMDGEIKYRWRIMCSWVQVFKFLVQSTASKLKVLLADFLFLLIFALVQRKYPICSKAWSLDRSSTRDYYSVAEDLFCIVVKET